MNNVGDMANDWREAVRAVAEAVAAGNRALEQLAATAAARHEPEDYSI